MSERRLRLVLVGIMLVTLFLPNTGELNWVFILWYSMLYLAGIASVLSSISGIIFWLGAMLFLLTVPALMLLNTFLVLAGFSTKLRRFYRILLLILFPLTWWGTLLRLSGGAWGVGLWAIPAVVTVAALMETAFVISDDLNKSQGTDTILE